MYSKHTQQQSCGSACKGHKRCKKFGENYSITPPNSIKVHLAPNTVAIACAYVVEVHRNVFVHLNKALNHHCCHYSGHSGTEKFLRFCCIVQLSVFLVSNLALRGTLHCGNVVVSQWYVDKWHISYNASENLFGFHFLTQELLSGEWFFLCQRINAIDRKILPSISKANLVEQF